VVDGCLDPQVAGALVWKRVAQHLGLPERSAASREPAPALAR
jgi:hypothetical protein